MRLERDVAQILQRENAEIAGVPENRRDWHRHGRKQRGDVHERQRVVVERLRVETDDERCAIGRDDAEVPPVRGVARQRHDARRNDVGACEVLGDLRGNVGHGV